MGRCTCILLLAGTACSDGKGHADAAQIPADAPPDAPACLTPPAGYGTVTPGMQEAFFDMSTGQMTPDYYELDALLNADPSPDGLLLQLYKGFGVFTAGYPTTFPQTYDITGAEAQFSTCGVCVLLLADLDAQGMATGNSYLATSGMVTITSITPMLAGSVSNLMFQRVAVAGDDVSMPDGSGCTTSLTSMSFSATPMPVPMAFTGRVIPDKR